MTWPAESITMTKYETDIGDVYLASWDSSDYYREIIDIWESIASLPSDDIPRTMEYPGSGGNSAYILNIFETDASGSAEAKLYGKQTTICDSSPTSIIP